MRFFVKVFRFDNTRDYNEYYERLELKEDSSASLKDLMAHIKENLKDFEYDERYFGFRINDKVVFNNVKLSDVAAYFGEHLEIAPISAKYAKKDLLIDKDAIFARYKQKLDKFSFLSEESRNEFSKYILMNLISPLDDEDYVGDGFCLYIKWMMVHYKEHAKELLGSISDYEDGVMNSVSTEYMLFPHDNSIDKEIEGLQRMLLQSIRCPFRRNHWVKIAKKVEASLERGKR